MVLSEAPTPDIVPTNPCARLNRPVRCEVGDDQRRQHAQHRSADAVEYLSGDENHWIGGLGEHQRSDRQRCNSNQQQRPATPPVRPAPRPVAISATITWGTMINAATMSEKRASLLYASASPASGSIDALAIWNKNTPPANVSRPRFFQSLRRRALREALGPW